VRARHLSFEARTNQGSFYTPQLIVDRLYTTLAKFASADTFDALLEPNCGYGALLNHEYAKGAKRSIGADIDICALEAAQSAIKTAQFYRVNMLENTSRKSYGIGADEKLLIVANPPYNDVTSQAKNAVKRRSCAIDADIATRDLGLSSILAFNKLRADFIAVLHPLSYLIKKSNFNTLKPFMQRYILKDALVFNSQVFSDTSKASGFPVLIAIYERGENGTSYDDIYRRRFKTIEGETFSLSQFDYIGAYLDKYPNKRKTQNDKNGYLFYTMRDINALKRSRTFIGEDIPNAVRVSNDKLDYYCYVDIFKDYADELPYYMGNLDIPIDRDQFEPLRECFRALSAAKRPELFAKTIAIHAPQALNAAQNRIRSYFDKLFEMDKR
jgi:hypothetical protein